MSANAPVGRIVLTAHALKRCREMGLSPVLVRDMVTNPAYTHTNRRHCLQAVRDGYSIVYAPQGTETLVLTVLVDRPDGFVERAS